MMSVKKVPRQHKDDESSYLLSSGKNSGNSHGSLTVSTNTTNGEGGRVEIVSSTKSASPESDTIVPSHFYNYKFQGTGTLERDEAGKSLTPFLVLAIFLLFSCLVVSQAFHCGVPTNGFWLYSTFAYLWLKILCSTVSAALTKTYKPDLNWLDNLCCSVVLGIATHMIQLQTCGTCTHGHILKSV